MTSGEVYYNYTYGDGIARVRMSSSTKRGGACKLIQFTVCSIVASKLVEDERVPRGYLGVSWSDCGPLYSRQL